MVIGFPRFFISHERPENYVIKEEAKESLQGRALHRVVLLPCWDPFLPFSIYLFPNIISCLNESSDKWFPLMLLKFNVIGIQTTAMNVSMITCLRSNTCTVYWGLFFQGINTFYWNLCIENIQFLINLAGNCYQCVYIFKLEVWLLSAWRLDQAHILNPDKLEKKNHSSLHSMLLEVKQTN